MRKRKQEGTMNTAYRALLLRRVRPLTGLLLGRVSAAVSSVLGTPLLSLSLLIPIPGTPQVAAAHPKLKVMTQNQYLGADLTPFLLDPTPAPFNQAVLDALTQIA